jgi:hypothetical protein
MTFKVHCCFSTSTRGNITQNYHVEFPLVSSHLVLSRDVSRQYNLTVVNALSVCEGLMTPTRIKEGNAEKSVLDFFVVCSRVLPSITKMVIDEKKDHILTNYTQAQKGCKAVESDHFTEYLDINLQLISEKPDRNEIFNFKDPESQLKFKYITTNTNKFSNCFDNDDPLQKQIENWRGALKSSCYESFKRVRINKKKPLKPLDPKISSSSSINQRNKLKRKNKSPESQMGERKGKGYRDNIFIINDIIHDVFQSKKKKPVLLQI